MQRQDQQLGRLLPHVPHTTERNARAHCLALACHGLAFKPGGQTDGWAGRRRTMQPGGSTQWPALGPSGPNRRTGPPCSCYFKSGLSHLTPQAPSEQQRPRNNTTPNVVVPYLLHRQGDTTHHTPGVVTPHGPLRLLSTSECLVNTGVTLYVQPCFLPVGTVPLATQWTHRTHRKHMV
jgi:hypothetical protein